MLFVITFYAITISKSDSYCLFAEIPIICDYWIVKGCESSTIEYIRFINLFTEINYNSLCSSDVLKFNFNLIFYLFFLQYDMKIQYTSELKKRNRE